jgi:hypothetical protein
LRYRSFGLAIEGEASLPASRTIGRGEVSASLLTGSLLPCGHVKFVFGCLVARAGALRGEGSGVTTPARATAGYAATGARVGVEVDMSGRLALVAYVEAVAPLTRITLQLDGADAWVVPAIAGRMGVGMKARF